MLIWNCHTSDESFMRLGVSILIDINEEWVTAKKYLSMDADYAGRIRGNPNYRNFGTLPILLNFTPCPLRTARNHFHIKENHQKNELADI